MKKLILLILLLAMAAANAIAARMYPAGGRVVDEQGQAVEYATVVLLRAASRWPAWRPTTPDVSS